MPLTLTRWQLVVVIWYVCRWFLCLVTSVVFGNDVCILLDPCFSATISQFLHRTYIVTERLGSLAIYKLARLSFDPLDGRKILLEERQEVGHMFCDVCGDSPAEYVVPERSDSEHCQQMWPFCLLCLDEMLGFFPIRVAILHLRELTGRLCVTPRLHRKYCL